MKTTPRGAQALFASLLMLFSFAGLAACGDDSDGGDNNDVFDPSDATGDDSSDGSNSGSIRLFSPDIQRVIVEVDYAEGAEPAIGGGLTSPRYWDLFETNAEKLFEVSAPTLTIPKSLDEMEAIGAVEAGPYTSGEILDLADDHRDTESAGSTASFYIVYLDGYFEQNGQENRGVIGVSIGRTGVVAIFKPVIENLGITAGAQAFGEQATLIHEFGHAVGLVNNPIPPQADHHDEEHGAHCSNSDCVMYWQNEGSSELAAFVQQFLLSGGTDTIVFDDDCLNDIRAVSSP